MMVRLRLGLRSHPRFFRCSGEKLFKTTSTLQHNGANLNYILPVFLQVITSYNKIVLNRCSLQGEQLGVLVVGCVATRRDARCHVLHDDTCVKRHVVSTMRLRS